MCLISTNHDKTCRTTPAEFSSPNYPRYYPNYANEDLIINIPSWAHLVIKILAFDLPSWYSWLKFIQVNPSDASMVSVTKNGQEVSNFFNNKYCGWASYPKALQVNSEYEIRGAESIKIEFRSDSLVTRSGFLIEYTMVLNEISTFG